MAVGQSLIDEVIKKAAYRPAIRVASDRTGAELKRSMPALFYLDIAIGKAALCAQRHIQSVFHALHLSMVRLHAILLLLVFSGHSIYNTVLIADYAARYDYYANVMCENKELPEMHCNGKCVLMQKMKAAQPAPVPVPEIVLLDLEATVPTILEVAVDWRIAVNDDHCSHPDRPEIRRPVDLAYPPPETSC